MPNLQKHANAPHWVYAKVRSAEWVVAREYEAALPKLPARALPTLRDAPDAVMVKAARSREVARVGLGDGREVYVKRYATYGLMRRVRALFEEPPAAAEWQILRTAWSKGVPTSRPVALGVTYHLGLPVDSYLVTESLGNGPSLRSFVRGLSLEQRARVAPSRRGLLAEHLAQFVATLFEAGLLHYDFKPKNILLSERYATELLDYFSGAAAHPAPRPELYIIDLDRAKLLDKLTVEQKVSSLSRFALYSVQHRSVAAADRARFLRALARCDPDFGADRPTRAAAIEMGAQHIVDKKYQRRDDRCLVGREPFHKMVRDDFVGFISRTMTDEAVLEALQAAAEAQAGATVVTEVNNGAHGLTRVWVYVTAATRRPHVQSTEEWALRWRACQALYRRHVPTPLPYGAGKRDGKGYVVVHAIEGGEPGRSVAERALSEDAAHPERERFLRALAWTMRRMHRAGLCGALRGSDPFAFGFDDWGNPVAYVTSPATVAASRDPHELAGDFSALRRWASDRLTDDDCLRLLSYYAKTAITIEDGEPRSRSARAMLAEVALAAARACLAGGVHQHLGPNCAEC